jgi:phosphoribosylglycinamide formyltransferase-1
MVLAPPGPGPDVRLIWHPGETNPREGFDTNARRRVGSAAVDARIAVLASGAGTNLQALLEDPHVGPWIALVLTDRPGAGALERANRRGVKTVVVDRSGYADGEGFDRAVLDALRAERIGFVALAGYMRILGREVVTAFPERILNVHPSLLPAFPGAHPVRDALEWGARVTGATVHVVDEQVDHGPIVAQEAVSLEPGDDERSLHQRIQVAERRLFPAALRALVEGRLKVEGRRVHVLEGDAVEAERTG